MMILQSACVMIPRRADVPPTPLKPVAILALDDADGLEPSGLAIHKGKLLMVSDDHDDTLYEIIWDKQQASVKPFCDLGLARLDKKADLEGLAMGPSDTLYMVSEQADRLAWVNLQSGESDWVDLDFGKAAQSKGMLRKKNAHGEGLACIGDGIFVVAAERQKRGLIKIDLNTETVSAYPMNLSQYRLASPARIPDFAGLHAEGDRLWALYRNASCIVEIDWSQEEPREGHFWSYAAVEESSALAFRSMRFGRCEGLTMDKHYIYIVMDNNGDPLKDSKDRRPRLFVFERPKNF